MASGLHTPLCDMLGIDYPIVLAGMGGAGSLGRWPAVGATPPKLVAAVSNAGGLGVMGGGASAKSADDFAEAVQEIRRLTDRPFGVDFLIPALSVEVGTKTAREVYAELERTYPQHVAFVRELFREHDLPPDEPDDEPVERTMKLVEVMLDLDVPVFACAVGEPPSWVVERGHAQGMKIIGMCGAVRHAQRQVAAGSDILVAQGTEAGGHTGNIATFVLVPQIVDVAGPRPVVAAGGVGSGRQVAAAMALGAQGVWVGTAFLAAEESNIPEGHQQQVIAGRSEDFTLSKYWSGKQARGYRSPVADAWAQAGLPPLPSPLQGVLMRPFLRAAERADRYDLISPNAGQVAGMVTARRPAKDIFNDLVIEAEETIEQLQHSIR